MKKITFHQIFMWFLSFDFSQLELSGVHNEYSLSLTIFKVKEVKLYKTSVSHDMRFFNFSSDFDEGFSQKNPYGQCNKSKASSEGITDTVKLLCPHLPKWSFVHLSPVKVLHSVSCWACKAPQFVFI